MKSVRLALIILPLIALAQLGEDLGCLECHQPDSWSPLPLEPRFDHNLATDFPLRHKHEDLACTQCHAGDSVDEFHLFKSKGAFCVDCHQDIHQNYWGQACEDCHTPEGWDSGISYRRHNETLFPLLGAHQSQSCYLCHGNPGSLPPLDCQACHATDFRYDIQSHQGLSPNTDCSTCHAPTRWDQILAINHDVFFPIYSGEHRGEWDACADCHNETGNYQAYTCFGSGCHSTAEMNDEHCDGRDCESCDGLTYPRSNVNSQDCYFCHPRGNKSKCGD